MFAIVGIFILQKTTPRKNEQIVTLGLVLDSSGFPERSHVYEGNVSEPATLSEMIHDLQ